MASTYLRPSSPFVWMRFKDDSGKWHSKPTQFRKDNPGDRRQAKLLAERMGFEERTKTPRAGREYWDDWVEGWLLDRYGRKGGTMTVYRRYWKRLRAWLLSERIHAPMQLSYQGALAYKEARARQGLGINSIIHELKFLGVVMGEAVRRGFAPANPCLKMGLQRAPRKEKNPWKPAEVRAVATAIGRQADWMQASFLLGYYQAARLRQCEVPLRDIDLARRRITYWKSLTGRPLTKGDKPFTQPIARAAIPLLRRLIARRRAAGSTALCELPLLPSVEWRRFLDGLGLQHLCHHGLRMTWITQAALSRLAPGRRKISREEAKAFVNHGSTAVHEIYQRLNADDVAHVADALHLPDLTSRAKRVPRRGARP